MEPQESVLTQLHETRVVAGGARLDLKAQSLNADTCAVLGRVLHKDTLFTELALCDCMLSEEGMYVVLYVCEPLAHASVFNLEMFCVTPWNSWK